MAKKFVGFGCEQFPAPGENQGSLKKAKAKIEGSGMGGAIKSGDPFGWTTDSRPEPGDNKLGATRSKK